MAIESGRTILHYRIVEKIGEGGMGVVWKAVDTTLDREVAIKVLPDVFASDAERLARFEQEARLLASLNHPSIAAVYSVHEHEGHRFLAMELVHGEDLSERLARGPLPQEQALKIALQVADALETAHDSGVVHRDLKPANIRLTPTGKVKVLDFGLAKALSAETASGDPSLSPTMTSAGTKAGVILGTAGYMSPEQARGTEIDRRTDIWAFGCVLYEMLSGCQTFEGETISDTLASILKTDPDWDLLPLSTPVSIRRLLRRCLTRDRDRRLSHIAGARLPLQETLEGESEIDAPAAAASDLKASTSVWSRRLPWALALLLALVAALSLWQVFKGGNDNDGLLTLVAPFPQEHGLPNDQLGVLALSPDGKTLAVVLEQGGIKHLHVRKLGRPDFIMLPGTEGAATPFFSPDGEWIGFFADDAMKKISVDGGNPMTLCESDGSNRGASWGTDNQIVFTPHYTQPLSRVSSGGGDPQPLTTIDTAAGERTHRWPQSVPSEDVVLFTVGTMDSPESYDSSRIDAVRPSTGERKIVLEGASIARYLPSGHLVFGREGFLFAVPFDIKRLETTGSPVPVVENVMGMRSSGVVYFGVANNGLLAYVSGAPRSRESNLVWRYRDGTTEPLAAPVQGYANPRLSPDRKQIAMGIEGDTTFDIWTFDIERETLTRLTFEGDNTVPVWSPDGRKIAFASVRGDSLMSVYMKAADGSGAAEMPFSPKGRENWGQAVPTSWSPDGRKLLIEFTNENASNVLAFSLQDSEEEILLESPAAESRPSASPDGRWMAYASDESGRFEVYVRSFSGSGGKWQISTDGGVHPRWAPDGKELYYRWQDKFFAARVDGSGGSFQASRPQVLFEGIATVTSEGNFDVYDSERFLFVEPSRNETAVGGVTVVINWLDDLRRRVPR